MNKLLILVPIVVGMLIIIPAVQAQSIWDWFISIFGGGEPLTTETNGGEGNGGAEPPPEGGEGNGGGGVPPGNGGEGNGGTVPPGNGGEGGGVPPGEGGEGNGGAAPPAGEPGGGGEPVPLPESCDDSDGGVNYYVRGTRVVEYGDGNGNGGGGPAIAIDSCINDITLREYYCEDNMPGSTVFGCRFGCANGACNPEISYQRVLNILQDYCHIYSTTDNSEDCKTVCNQYDRTCALGFMVYLTPIENEITPQLEQCDLEGAGQPAGEFQYRNCFCCLQPY